MPPSTNYRGRFAPSPTGPLHIGSLIAAVGSYLDARQHGGQWLLRIEDLDTPRCVPGAADDILRTLEHVGLHWDGAVSYQSQRIPLYQAALDDLRQRGLAYPCHCSRKTLATQGERAYSGHCRRQPPDTQQPHAWRLAVRASTLGFEDRAQGWFAQDLPHEVGDFVLKRLDGLFAYQLAVVVDDAAQGISDVVRGADLLDSTPRQIELQQQLGLPTPRYLHLPLAVNAAGEKLSKQTLARAIGQDAPLPLLRRVLAFLHQPAPPDTGDVRELLTWASAHWQPARFAHQLHQPDPSPP